MYMHLSIYNFILFFVHVMFWQFVRAAVKPSLAYRLRLLNKFVPLKGFRRFQFVLFLFSILKHSE